jgi:hypothetical protein
VAHDEANAYDCGMPNILPRFVAICRKGGSTIWSQILEACDVDEAGLLAWTDFANDRLDGDMFADLPQGADFKVAPLDA